MNLARPEVAKEGGMEPDVKRGITMSWCSSEGPFKRERAFKVKERGTRCRPILPVELRFFDVKICANHVGKCRRP